jgi:small subunit ribosomal protein S16
MLAIRMRRLGAKKRPFFRVVVIDSHSARGGRSVEVLGYYNPTSQPETLKINRERLDHWMSKGAQPSDTVRTLLGRHPAGEAPEVAVETPVLVSATPPAATPPESPDPPSDAPTAESDEPAAVSEEPATKTEEDSAS